jgi:hypothetical protein
MRARGTLQKTVLAARAVTRAGWDCRPCQNQLRRSPSGAPGLGLTRAIEQNSPDGCPLPDFHAAPDSSAGAFKSVSRLRRAPAMLNYLAATRTLFLPSPAGRKYHTTAIYKVLAPG